MKSVVLCAEFIAVVVLQKGNGEKRWWKKGRGEEVVLQKGCGRQRGREGWGEIEEDKEEERGGEKGSYWGIIHSDYISLPIAHLTREKEMLITHIIPKSLWCSPLHRELCPFLFGDDFSCQPKI